MKATTQTVRMREWIPFINYALVDKVPAAIKLRDHLFPYEGAEANPDFLWGVYGTVAGNQTLFLADEMARRSRKILLTILGKYKVDNFDKVRSQIDRPLAEESGFIHLERTKIDFRDEVREMMLDHATPMERSMFDDKSLLDIALRRPQLILAVFKEMRKVNMVVHPVRQMYSVDETRPVAVATMRFIKSRIMAAEVRYLDGVKVQY